MILARLIRQFVGPGDSARLVKDVPLPAVPPIGSRVSVPAEDFAPLAVVGITLVSYPERPGIYPPAVRVFLEPEALDAAGPAEEAGWRAVEPVE